MAFGFKSVGRVLLLYAFLQQFGCGGTALGDPVFAGNSQPYRTPPEGIADQLMMPKDYVALGEIEVDCQSLSRSDGLFFLNTWGSCDTSDLIAALKKRASVVGGDALVARRCDSDSDESLGFDHKPARTESISCKAVVARKNDVPLPQDPNQPKIRLLDGSTGAVSSATTTNAMTTTSATTTSVSTTTSATPEVKSQNNGKTQRKPRSTRTTHTQGSCSKLPCAM
jgi:hypothetical protein